MHCAKDVCEICASSKITKVSVPKETEVKSTKRIEKFIDTLGPLNLPSVHGFRYVLMIVDGYSKFKVGKFLRAPSEALEKIQELIAEHGNPKVPTCKHQQRVHLKKLPAKSLN